MTGAALAAGFLHASTVSGFANEADLRDGDRLFRSQCLGCHSLEPGDNRAGPTLAGLFGRQAGTVVGFDFSRAMAETDIEWTPETLDEFLSGPGDLVPGTKMVLWPLEDTPRRQIISYLKSLSE